jgi:hypothetical protein
LWSDLAAEWLKLLEIIHGVNLTPGDDRVTWKLGQKGVTAKIKMFLWCLIGDKQCMFCARDESIDHLFCAYNAPAQPKNG